MSLLLGPLIILSLIAIALFCLGILTIIQHLVKRKAEEYISQNKEWKASEQHAAIIAVDYKGENDFYQDGIDYLIRLLRKRQKSYKVYFPTKASQFKEIVRDEKVTKLYIFGHGRRDAFRFGFGERDYLEYETLKDYRKLPRAEARGVQA